MHKDAIGREIEVGHVCVYVSRSGSSMYFEPIIIRELLQDGIKGDKVITSWVWRGDKPYLRPSNLIQRTEHLIITDLTEESIREKYDIPA